MEEIELREYWHIIRKFWKMVLAIPLIAVIVSGVISFFVLTPQYQADTSILVNQKQITNSQLQYQDITTSQALVKTYSDLMKSVTVENAVISQLNLPYTNLQLDKMISVASPDASQVIQVTVTSPSQSQSVQIANALAQVFQQKAQQWMQIRNIQIIDPATAPTHPVAVKPNKKLNVAIAFILGLMISVGLAFLREYLDMRLRNEEEIQNYLKLPVLGTVIEYGTNFKHSDS